MDSDFELIAEEAYNLPTTVGHRLACRLNKPWLNVDMDEAGRKEAGIYEELCGRHYHPLLEDDDPPRSCAYYYLAHADGVREDYWVSQLAGQRVSSAIMVCGLAHLSPLAKKFRNLSWDVEELNVCELDWYIANFGTVKVIEDGYGRRSEHRPLPRQGR